MPAEFWVNIVTPTWGHSITVEAQITYCSDYHPQGKSESIILEHANNIDGTPTRHTGRFPLSNIYPILAERHNLTSERRSFYQKVEFYRGDYQDGQWVRYDLIDVFNVHLLDDAS